MFWKGDLEDFADFADFAVLGMGACTRAPALAHAHAHARTPAPAPAPAHHAHMTLVLKAAKSAKCREINHLRGKVGGKASAKWQSVTELA